MNPGIVDDLLVSPELAKTRLQLRLDLLDPVRSGKLDQVTWYDDTIATLEALFASKAANYFYVEGGFKFTFSYRGRIFNGANLERAQGILRRMIDGIGAKDAVQTETPVEEHSSRVFVVHGHDEVKILQVKELLQYQGLVPVILRDQPNSGRTIIDKFEQSSDVGFAVVLMTADDVGSKQSEAEELNPRARQNVVLELGYFIGKLGRPRVCALLEARVEIPSDIHGVVYTPIDENGAWKYALLDELRAAGYAIDKNKI